MVQYTTLINLTLSSHHFHIYLYKKFSNMTYAELKWDVAIAITNQYLHLAAYYSVNCHY